MLTKAIVKKSIGVTKFTKCFRIFFYASKIADFRQKMLTSAELKTLVI